MLQKPTTTNLYRWQAKKRRWLERGSRRRSRGKACGVSPEAQERSRDGARPRDQRARGSKTGSNKANANMNLCVTPAADLRRTKLPAYRRPPGLLLPLPSMSLQSPPPPPPPPPLSQPVISITLNVDRELLNIAPPPSSQSALTRNRGSPPLLTQRHHINLSMLPPPPTPPPLPLVSLPSFLPTPLPSEPLLDS